MKIILRIVASLGIGVVTTALFASRISAPPAKLVILVGVAAVAFFYLPSIVPFFPFSKRERIRKIKEVNPIFADFVL
jgi:uncharacterized membrane protein